MSWRKRRSTKSWLSDPKNAQALNYLGYMLADRGTRLDEALGYIRRAVALDPQNGAYLDSLGWVYYRMGNYDLAEENLRRASEKIGSDPTVQAHLGDLYQKTGHLKLATSALAARAGRVEQDHSSRGRYRRNGQGAEGPRVGQGTTGQANSGQRLERFQSNKNLGAPSFPFIWERAGKHRC